LRELATAGIVVSVHMGIDHVGDGDIGFFGLIDEPLLVAGHHVHGHGFAFSATAEKIGER